MTELIPVQFHKILQTQAYTTIILGTDQKKIAIYTEPLVGKHLQTYLTEEENPRPQTHDFIDTLLRGLEVKILQVVIHHLEDTVYFARIFLEQNLGDRTLILEIDARPSDCITLAIMHNAPVFCKKDLFDEALGIEA